MNEKTIQNDIVRKIGTRPDTRIFRNNTGQAWAGHPSIQKQGEPFRRVYGATPVKFGLCKGSSDLIGFKQVTITPDMVGQRFAQFVAIEVKYRGKPTPEQKSFIDFVNSFGGLAGVARSADDAEGILK